MVTPKTSQNGSLAEKLATILCRENVSNSYYNDECYLPCKTANYDQAYDIVIPLKFLKEEDLKSTYPMKDSENGTKVDFPLKEILKMVVIGDFGNQYKETSSLTKNFQAIINLWELTHKNLSPEKHKEFWFSKTDGPEAKDLHKLRGREYQLAYLKKRSMAEMVGNRLDFYNLTSKETLQGAYKIARKLIKDEGFLQEATTQYQIDACERLIGAAETGEEKQKITKEILTIAQNVKNKCFEEVAKLQHYDLRRVAITNLLYGKSQDAYFDNLVKSIEGIENMISKRGKILDIEI